MTENEYEKKIQEEYNKHGKYLATFFLLEFTLSFSAYPGGYLISAIANTLSGTSISKSFKPIIEDPLFILGALIFIVNAIALAVYAIKLCISGIKLYIFRRKYSKIKQAKSQSHLSSTIQEYEKQRDAKLRVESQERIELEKLKQQHEIEVLTLNHQHEIELQRERQRSLALEKECYLAAAGRINEARNNMFSSAFEENSRVDNTSTNKKKKKQCDNEEGSYAFDFADEDEE